MDDNHEALEDGPFRRSAETQSCTLTCQAADGHFLGDSQKPVRVIDTPGHGDSQGRDHSFRDEIIRTMREEKVVHAFLLTKNAQAPRVDMQDIEFFEILRGIFGAGFFSNVVIVFTRLVFSTASAFKICFCILKRGTRVVWMGVAFTLSGT